MSHSQEAVTYGGLLLLLGDIAAQVIDLEIHEGPNRHGQLLVTVLAEEPVKEYLLYEGEGTASLFCQKDDGLKVLFQGTVQHMKVSAVSETYYIRMEVHTNSCRMDVDRYLFSFQDTTMTYQQLFTVIMGLYPGSRMSFSAGDQPLGGLVLQYQETSWEFLKRMSSAYGTQLFVNSAGHDIQIRMGLSEAEDPVELEGMSYTVNRNIAPKRNDEKLKSQVVYQVECFALLALGDRVLFHGQELFIGQADRYLRDGLLVNRYRLYFKEGLGIEKYNNPLISGISIGGTVSGISRNRVQVKMETDALENWNSPCYFPFSTIAASPDGSGWYCMPKAGDRVRIFFPVSDEREGYAIANIQGQPAPSGEDPMGNPDLKDITTPDNKTVKFIENGILLSVGEGKGSITLTNDGKAEINSEEDIEIGAAQMVKITTDKELKLTAEVEIQFTSDAGSSITVTEEGIQAKASKIINN